MKLIQNNFAYLILYIQKRKSYFSLNSQTKTNAIANDRTLQKSPIWNSDRTRIEDTAQYGVREILEHSPRKRILAKCIEIVKSHASPHRQPGKNGGRVGQG